LITGGVAVQSQLSNDNGFPMDEVALAVNGCG